MRYGRAESHSVVQRSPRSHSSASLRSRSALALSAVARASLRYRSARALVMGISHLRRMQIALKPSAKGLRMHRIFVGGEGRKYVIADTALKRMQVHARALWLDADEHHRRFALRTGRALKCDRRNGGRRALRLGHDDSLRIGGSATLSVTGKCQDVKR